MESSVASKVYQNEGNADVCALVDSHARDILDVGCGAGGNAARLNRLVAGRRVYGITGSRAEAELASSHLAQCWLADLEGDLPRELLDLQFDCLFFSHVLEHLRSPATLVARLSSLLRPGGSCVIAVPNVLNWRERLQFMRGRFEYADSGTLDATHLRFFTHETAAKLLLAEAPQLRLVTNDVTGSVPLWFLRRHVLPQSALQRIDSMGCALRPNLFGSQVLIKAVYEG